MVGLVVTPTTCLSRTSAFRFPDTSRARLMSSSQTATPSSDNSFKGSDIGYHSIGSNEREAQRGSHGAPQAGRTDPAAAELAAVGLHWADDASVTPGASWWSRPSCARAVATTFSVVKPNLDCSTFMGADSPNVLMPIMAPVVPTHRSQPNGLPFSTDTRAVTAGG